MNKLPDSITDEEWKRYYDLKDKLLEELKGFLEKLQNPSYSDITYIKADFLNEIEFQLDAFIVNNGF